MGRPGGRTNHSSIVYSRRHHRPVRAVAGGSFLPTGTVVQAVPFRRAPCQNKGLNFVPYYWVPPSNSSPIVVPFQRASSVTSREEFHRPHCRLITLLSWTLAAALLCTFAVVEPALVNVVCAQEKDADQDEADEEPTEKETSKPEKPPVRDNAEADEPASDEEQEKAEDATGEEVSEDREAADEEEDARAAAEEAAGAEVEVDESGEEEEVTEEEGGEEEKPTPKNGDKKDPDKEVAPVPKRVIGATATIMEKQSELLFRARVDSGAKSCSLHIEEYNIKDEEELMADNIGKVITFRINNGNNEPHWLEAKIAGYVVVKTSAHRERRYKVPLKLQYKDFEKTVLVTLNNREKMEYPLLLGRNFLMGDFVVDVEVDNEELHTR
jgi:hypothetical protein